MRSDVLIVGAAAAGLTVAETLRRKGFVGSIRMVGDEPHPPYDRPPLSKQVLAGEWEPARAALRSSEVIDALDMRLDLGVKATALNVIDHTVAFDDGTVGEYGSLVIATGLRPRQLPDWDGIHGVQSLHSLSDSLRLREQLTGARDVVIAGAGVLGCEMAATARKFGAKVTIIDPVPSPMLRVVGEALGARIRALHEAHGVEFRLETMVRDIIADGGRVVGVDVGDEVIPADIVVVSIGSSPATGWLESSGLELADGVVCDANCRAAEDVYAAGDVARWYDKRRDAHVRFENRTNASEQGMLVARNILGEELDYTPIAYFWTDQYDVKIQVYGTVPDGATVETIEDEPERNRFLVRAISDGRVTGVVGWNNPRGVRMARQEIVDSELARQESLETRVR
ncbi:NAD(P)/FAD-dependent oxidoreductase [Rhodococcus sp. WS4]|nr:NAD(P)/FAD-dependent oxidoreductase [Rhodococcus sp. WS4]